LEYLPGLQKMLISIHSKNPQPRLITQIVEALKKDAVIIYPTDTVYALGCDINSKKAFEKVCRIKGIKPEKAQFSCICDNVSIISDYALHVTTPTFKLLKRALPGPFTFILEASKGIPKHFQEYRKTVGIRVTSHQIVQQIVSQLGNPIMTTSLPESDPVRGYPVDAEEIFNAYGNLVDIVIDGGPGGLIPSTVIDCSKGDNEISVVREGLGNSDSVL